MMETKQKANMRNNYKVDTMISCIQMLIFFQKKGSLEKKHAHNTNLHRGK